MRSKAGIIALTGECLTIAAVFWTAIATLLQKDADPPFPGLIWSLILAAFSIIVFLPVLRKGASAALLALIFVALLALNITAYILLYPGAVTAGYVLCVILLSAVTAGVALYYGLVPLPLSKHLVFIDGMIFCLLWLFLFLGVLNIEPLSILCAAGIVFLDIGGAVVLRMSEGGTDEGMGKAFALAVGSSGIAALIIFLLVSVFSRSQRVTGAVLSFFRTLFIKIWEGIDAFFAWLSRFFSSPETEAVSVQMMTPEEITREEEFTRAGLNPLIPAIAFGAIAVIILIIAVWKFRKTRFSLKLTRTGEAKIVRQKRIKRSGILAKLLEKITFMKNAFLYRNTPKGMLVWLEKKAAHRKIPRAKGETVRKFLERLSPRGTLSVLADELDAGLYGGLESRLSPQECKSLKKVFAREWKTNTV